MPELTKNLHLDSPCLPSSQKTAPNCCSGDTLRYSEQSINVAMLLDCNLLVTGDVRGRAHVRGSTREDESFAGGKGNRAERT
jgi:hypothetical protein